MMQTDVKAAKITATGSVYAGPARVKGIYVVSNTTAGSIVLTDGGASGLSRLAIDTPASGTSNPFFVPIPGEGVQFTTNVYATLTNVVSVTFFYG